MNLQHSTESQRADQLQASDGPKSAGPIDATRGSLTLIVGGVRSGKSNFAQSLATRLGSDDVLFVATAEARDGEMHRRIQLHRDARPSAWTTAEIPQDVGVSLAKLFADQIQNGKSIPKVILLDCLTLLISNEMCSSETACDDVDLLEAKVRREVQDIIKITKKFDSHVVIVSGEVGSGVVPEHAMGRLFRDLLGMANQQFSAVATSTYLMISGLAIEASAIASSVDQAAEKAMSAASICRTGRPSRSIHSPDKAPS